MQDYDGEITYRTSQMQLIVHPGLWNAVAYHLTPALIAATKLGNQQAEHAVEALRELTQKQQQRIAELEAVVSDLRSAYGGHDDEPEQA